MTEGQSNKELTEQTNTSSMYRGLTLLFWMSLRMCSKQLLLRNTAWRTGLSEHCRISGTAAKIGNKEDVDSFIRHWGNQLSGLHTDWERNSFYSARLETLWTLSYLAFGFEGRSGRLPSSACPAPHCLVDGSSWGAGSSCPVWSWSPPAALPGCWSEGGGSSPSGTARSAAGAPWSWVLGRSDSTMLAELRTGPQQSEGWWRAGHSSEKISTKSLLCNQV